MKTRIIKTRMWGEDEKFGKLTPNGKLGFLYYITNERINISGIYECPNRITTFEMGITEGILHKIQEELEKCYMVLFKDGWVYVVNAEKHNKYRNSPDNEKAYQREIDCIPKSIHSHFIEKSNSTVESTVDSSLHSNHKQEIRINNKEILNDIVVIEELKNKFSGIDVEQELEKMRDWLASSGKQKKDYVAFARTWLRKCEPRKVVSFR